ncbi:conserved repeat domain-containing protein [Thiothrix caldifontis]|uniref:Conserved repeat domain-containing protein n=1 Tax=Thiothrix caldifontis TaxID=525918 RepID=A0A1H3WGE1_9GAMM|nr:DUF11 domain-containing protein [Thiothrix caldifontis]SDZ85298.1 conserved repeat domain-containing protein [Thiothrix caldifontis]
MKPLQMNKLAGACATALLAGGIMLHASPVIAATAAGTQIKNLATVTYEDENGNTYSAQSNEAVITVKQVYAAELGVDTTKTAAAGQMVYSQHTLTNNGNGKDTYTLNVADITGDDLTADSIQLFIDSNGNGLADAGETMVAAGGTVTLTGGQSVALVMAVKVPATATAGNKLYAKLTATTSNGSVVDLTSSGGYDSANNTNHTLITVANDAVLNHTKSAVLDAANNQIAYTLTVTNTGNQVAQDVEIFDALPGQTSFVSASAAGLLTGNGDTLPVSQSLSEATAGADLNKDGDMVDILPGIYAKDAALAPGATISVTFRVAYDPLTFNNNSIPGSAGDIVKNTGFLKADQDGNAITPPVIVPSNPVQTVLPQLYGVVTDDTGDNAKSAPHNDGLDDNTLDDVQLVTTAPPGSAVWFSVDVTNNGTGRDTFELTTSGSSFPPGTVFTYWNASGTVQLVDTNSKGGVDTGMLESGDTARIVVKAQLPTNAANGGIVTLTATSATAPTTVSDTTTLQLQAISAAGVDLFDNTGSAGTSANEDALGTAPYNINHGTNPGTRQAMAATVGSTVKIPLYIDNGSGSSDSFQFSIGSSWNGTTVGGLPTGWSALFYKADASGNPTGSPLTSTALLPAGSLGNAATNQYVAVVTIPNDPAYALADYLADNNGDGTPDIMDANLDGDGDQPVFISITSANSGASDIMLDAIDVENLAQVELTPPGSNQIQPGGSVNYINTLENTGNTTETLELTSANSLSGESWGNTVKVDTNGDGIPDKTLAELQPGDVIKGVDVAGNVVNIPVTDADNDGNPEVTMNPGEKFDLTPTVFAPSSAAPGQTDVLTLYATNIGTGPSTSVEDVSIVILGQVRLDKQVAIDANCDGTPEGTFQANLTTEVAPTECAIWQIQSENQGDALAKNVIIRDKVPAYSTYEVNSLKYCLNLGCAPAAVTNEGEIVGSDIAFYVGTGSVPASQLGGDLQPGQQATVRFSTKVQ